MPVTVDSLVANEFAFEINGEKVSGVFRISYLVTFQLGEDGKPQMPPFEIAKMVERDANSPFNRWLRETRAAAGSLPRRDVTVVAVDDGVETRRWTARNAYIKEVRYSPFESASFEMIEEIFVLQAETVDETFPASH